MKNLFPFRVITLIFLLTGFHSNVLAQPSNDNFANAIDVTSILGSCSADAAYTTIGGTADQNIGSCWNNSGPRFNVWFKFEVPSTGEVYIEVNRGGALGTQRRAQLSLWQNDGLTEIECEIYNFDNENIDLNASGLTPGDTLYISVDAFNGSYDGTFTLCLDSLVDYDQYEGALDVTSLLGTCSADAAYSTTGASPDQLAASCWNNSGPQFNRWFKFTAPTTGIINITVDRGSTKGSQRRTQLALWENDGVTEIACDLYSFTDEDVDLGVTGLIVGQEYYISVDAFNASYDGTFTLCLDTVADYDFYEGAIDVTSILGGCSADAAYTTIGASPDRNAGSCWNNSGPLLNRWFSFTAPSTGIVNVTVDRGGSKGSQRRTQLALWESDGLTEVACELYAFTDEDVDMGVVGLTPANTYYLSVDAFNASYDGSFTLCIDTVADYDFFEGAIDVTSLIGGCSSDAAYTTIGASPDRNAGSCWNNGGPLLNRWFSFKAPTNGVINITVDRGGSQGTQRRTQIALWEDDGVTEVACKIYAFNDEDVSLGTLGLTAGDTYYISVDAFNTNYDGTFTLCLDSLVDYDFYEGAIDVTSILGSCSPDAEYNTIGATADKLAGSCWNNSGPQFNRWFSFIAPNNGIVNIKVDRGGVKGSQRRTQIALWESDGVTEVDCKRYAFNDEDVILGTLGLTGGNTYYISVDAFNASYDGTFTLCIDTLADYDFYEGAIDITPFIGGCTPNAAYTTIGASPDLFAGSCWNNSGPQFNRWFKFTAPPTGRINITVDRGGSKGSQRRTQMALWEADGVTEVDCKRYAFNDEDVEISVPSITPGLTYYLSVDAFNASYDGTFTICINDDVSYDYFDGAIELTNLNNWCSTDARFTTIGGTPDLNAGSCWNNSGPRFNKWFKFTAVSDTVTIVVDRGGTKGSQRRTQLALWEDDGVTERQCARYSFNDEDVSLTDGNLTVGNVYYISVDAFNTSYDGTFTLCIDNVDIEYFSRADGDWTNPNTWSNVDHTGVAAPDYPDVGDIVFIEGHQVTLDADVECAEVSINVATANTELIIDGFTLDVDGKFKMLNPGNNFNGDLSLINGGSLDVLDSLIVERQGGTNGLSIVQATNTSIIVNKDLMFRSSGGTSVENSYTLNGTASLLVGRDLLLSEDGGIKSKITANNNAAIDIIEGVDFSGTTDDRLEIEMNDNSTFKIGGNITLGSPEYGILDFNDNTALELNGASKQTLPTFNGSGGTDFFDVPRLIFNNTFGAIPQIELTDDLTIDDYLFFGDGVLGTNGSTLIFDIGAYATNDNTESYVDGPVQINGSADAYFPVGDDDVWAPAELENLTGDAASTFTVEYFFSAFGTYATDAMLNNVSTLEYWTIDNGGTASDADVTLHFKDTSRSRIDSIPGLVIAHYNSGGGFWENLGSDFVTISDPGYIRVDGVSSFSPFTFGSLSPTSNPLPVTLVDLRVIKAGKYLNLISWSTLAEINNDHFVIERSFDGKEFVEIHTIAGAGNTTQRMNYEYSDINQPLGEISDFTYYQLKQVDYDGTVTPYGPVAVSNKRIISNTESEQLSPNPAKAGSMIRIKLNEYFETDNFIMRLTDLSGTKVIESSLRLEDQNSFNWQIPSELAAGFYILKIDNGRQEVSFKLAVQ